MLWYLVKFISYILCWCSGLSLSSLQLTACYYFLPLYLPFSHLDQFMKLSDGHRLCCKIFPSILKLLKPHNDSYFIHCSFIITLLKNFVNVNGIFSLISPKMYFLFSVLTICGPCFDNETKLCVNKKHLTATMMQTEFQWLTQNCWIM